MTPIEYALLFWGISAALHALPKPPDNPKGFWQNFYTWAHGTAQFMGANLDRIIPGKPQPK